MSVLTLNLIININDRADLPLVTLEPWSSRWIRDNSRLAIIYKYIKLHSSISSLFTVYIATY